MTGVALGVVLGAAVGFGLWLITAHVWAVSRGTFEARVLSYLGDMPQLRRRGAARGPTADLVLKPLLQRAAGVLDRVVGGSTSVHRRLQRAGLDITVQDFRAQQVTAGVVAFAATAVLAITVAWRSPERALPLAILTCVAALGGVIWRDNRLSTQVRTHEDQVLAELPVIAELLALAVAAGEGPVAALDRVVSRSSGALSRDLSRVLGEIRTGKPVARAFDDLAARTGLPVVARFANGVAVAVERGTPLAEVLHAQAGDVREARRRALIESGARREVAMMIPVVFLVLPTTILFAFWPGVIGLRLVTP
jgi:tight adherence protein C